MALTFRQAMQSAHMRAQEIGRLADLGDDLSRRVINYYRQAWEAFHKARHDENLLDLALKKNLVSTVTEYLHRDLTISDLQDLQSKFGHRLPGQSPDPKKLQ